MSGSSRGSMALAASALQLFEEARTAADRPSTGAGVGGMVDPTSFGAAAHDNTASGSHRRKRSKGSKRRFQQAAAAAEEAVLRKASFGKAKKEIGERGTLCWSMTAAVECHTSPRGIALLLALSVPSPVLLRVVPRTLHCVTPRVDLAWLGLDLTWSALDSWSHTAPRQSFGILGFRSIHVVACSL
jgi:hypothetical protein